MYLMVEGNDDVRFVNGIVRPALAKKYDVHTYKYASRSKDVVSRFISGIGTILTDNYIMFADMDDAICYAKKKQTLKQNVATNVDQSRIAIVNAEIESWYVAGLPRHDCTTLGVSIPPDTHAITKDEFNGLIPPKFLSRVDFMMYLLEKFSVDTAKERNSSFRYCWSRFVEPAAP